MQKAVELFECIVTIQIEVLAENYPNRLASQHTLATAYRSNGQVQKAVELLEHVVAIEAEILAEDHPDRLASQHELARVYKANGQVQKAVDLLKRVVAIRAEVLAEDHPDRLASEQLLPVFHTDLSRVIETGQISGYSKDITASDGDRRDFDRNLEPQHAVSINGSIPNIHTAQPVAQARLSRIATLKKSLAQGWRGILKKGS